MGTFVSACVGGTVLGTFFGDGESSLVAGAGIVILEETGIGIADGAWDL